MGSLSAVFSTGQRMMVQYCHSTIFVLGMIGSLLNILLFSRRHSRSNPCCIYFLVSSISALILLSIGILPQLYALYNSPNPFTSIQSFCKARSYLNQTSAMSCRWLLVMACIDRCISCSTNATVRRFSSIIITRRLVVIISVVWLIVPIHVPIFSNIQPPGNIVCSITNDNVALYHRFYTIIMGGVLPSMISFISCLVIWRSFEERKKRRIIVPTNEANRRRKVRDQHILMMLLTQVAIFIVSTIPFMSFNIYDTMTRTITNKSADRKAIEAFVKTFTEFLVYLIAMSFYSNTLVSPTFRKELITLVQEIFTYARDPRHRRINPSNLTATRNNTLIKMAPMRTSIPEYGMSIMKK